MTTYVFHAPGLAERLGLPAYTGDPYDREALGAALAGAQALVYAAPRDDLEAATRGTYTVLTAAARAGVGRVVLVGTLALFGRIPREWPMNEGWRPRPEPRPDHLAPWLAELSAREIVRAAGLSAACLRVGRAVDEAETAAAVRAALAERDARTPSWRVRHIGEAVGRPPDDGRPWRDYFSAPPLPERPMRRVVIFGAGGPVGTALAEELAPDYTLLLTDARPLADILAENKPQSPGAPLPRPPAPPHAERVVDVRDPAAVLAACEGADAIVNCTVVREDPVDAFRANTLGAYNICRAAAAHGIPRLVQTGPQLLTLHDGGNYAWDYDVSGDPPMRPGMHLYSHSKYLGQEVCRVFAENVGLTVPVLLFTNFVNPAVPGGLHPMTVSFADSARALRAALESPLPSPYEEFHIGVDAPHGRFRYDKAHRLLGWQPLDSLEDRWRGRSA